MPMLETSQPWNLFGYDLRQGFFWFKAGWRDFLWGTDSPVLPVVDETVALYGDGAEPSYFRAGAPADAPGADVDIRCKAVLLPDRLVLPRRIRIPRAAEGDLEAAVLLEVQANSPFPADDTCYGWTVVGSDDHYLTLLLVISSSSAIMEVIGGRFDCHDKNVYEVWARVDDSHVILKGFGEDARRERNRGRMTAVGLKLIYIAAALVALFAVAAGLKYLELKRVEAVHESIKTRAARAMELREGVSAGKQRIDAANALVAETPDLQLELARLTRLLDSDTWLAQMDLQRSRIRIEGQSPDAAKVMQTLSDEDVYEKVTAPVAIRKVSRSDLERFVLDLALAPPGTAP
jgi:hypothetical protein